MPMILVCDCCGRVPEGCICDPRCDPGLKEREVTEETARAYDGCGLAVAGRGLLKHLPVPALPEGDDAP